MFLHTFFAFILQQWNHPSHTTAEYLDLTKKYFEILSDEEITKLYHIYQNDFIMFNYTFTFRNKTYGDYLRKLVTEE